MYIYYCHRVLPDKLARNSSGPDQRNVMSVSDFQASLDALSEFECVSLRDTAYSTFTNRHFALTFDDGFKDNLEIVLPILKERGLPATYFITTRFLNGEIPFEYKLWSSLAKSRDRNECYESLRSKLKTASYRKRQQALSDLPVNKADGSHSTSLMLSKSELYTLSEDDLLTIGSHSHSHLVLSRQAPWLVFNELRYSKRYLEAVTNNAIDLFAYPYGARSFMTDWLARLAGYSCIFSTRPAPALSRQFCMPRIPLNQVQHIATPDRSNQDQLIK